jgi:LPS export ABC transporter protein LptC
MITTSPNQPPKTHEPDYYFTDATVTTLGEDGQPASELKSPRIIHHPDDDSTESFDPRMRYFTKHGMPWYVQSDHAVSPSGNHWVYLIARQSSAGEYRGSLRMAATGAVMTMWAAVGTLRKG